MKIVIDTKGSDKGASVLIAGAAKAIEKFEDVDFLLVGDRELIEKECSQLSIPESRIEVLDAPDEITNYDSPADAIFRKSSSSMVRALDALGTRDDLYGIITAGNTGALLIGSMRYLPDEVRTRPVLSAVLPAENGSFTCLVDTGATIDCTPDMLHHFARLGRDFMHDMYGLESPRVGLLSNGAESTKGNALVKATHPILAADPEINFVGNIEGNRALSGDCDVLVCDGFAGNQILKVTEGTATRIITDVMKYAYRKGSDEIKALGAHLMGIYDIGSLGGGYILGVRKPVIKIRGNSGETAVVSATQMLVNMSCHRAMFDKSKNTI